MLTKNLLYQHTCKHAAIVNHVIVITVILDAYLVLLVIDYKHIKFVLEQLTLPH